jgi:hypothetical protein
MTDWFADARTEVIEMLSDAYDDYIGLWIVIRAVQDRLPEANEAELKAAVLDLVRDLVDSGTMLAGEPAEDGLPVVPWYGMPTEQVIRIIDRRWD